MAGRGKKRTQIAGQFSWRLVEMQESPAYRVLSLSERRVLDRLEIELGHHAGHDNGKLPCTYDHFEDYGVHRHSIGPALRAVAALGFIEVTEQGRAGNAEWRRPNLFRLTYRHTANADPTDEWKRIKSVEDAEFVARAAREARPRKRNASGGKRTELRCGNRTTSSPIHSAVSATTCVSAETTTTSISRVEERRRDREKCTAERTSTSAIDQMPPGGFGGTRTLVVIHNGVVTRIAVLSDRPGGTSGVIDAPASAAAAR